MKIVKNFLKLITVLCTLLLILGAVKIYFSVERIIPYPYAFLENAQLNESDRKKFEEEKLRAQNSKVLIIGDRMGIELNKTLPELEEKIKSSLNTNLTFYNWSSEHESLARSLNKLKSLTKFPSIIIYHGASSEFYEQKFHLKDRNFIVTNFKNYDNDQFLSLLITFPFLSRLFYLNDTTVMLGAKAEKDKTTYQEGEKIQVKDLLYKLYSYELRELIELVKSNNSTLIFITSPLNYEIAPVEICSEVNTNSIIEIHQEVAELIKNGDAKGAYTLIKELHNEVVGNAETQFLRGMAAMKLGEIAEAREALSLAISFDCGASRGDPVFNEIMRTEAKKQLAFLIDFDQMGKSQLGGEPFFIDQIYPHNLYYQKLNEEIFIVFKKILNIK